MSSYSLEIVNSEKYSQEFEENILYSFDNYMYKKHFRVGEGIKDENELKHNLIFSRILCEDSCEIINYIQDKIMGKIESCKKIKKSISQTLVEFTNCNNSKVVCMNNNNNSCKPIWTEALW